MIRIPTRRSLFAGTALVLATVTCSEPTPPPVSVATVSLAPANATMVIGTSQQFTATTLDGSQNPLAGRKVSWSVSSAIAAITDSASTSATIVAKALGSGTLTATSEGKSASAVITVITGVTGVTVSKIDLVIVGTSRSVTASVAALPGVNQAVAWSSSNSSIASVSSGAGGSANINGLSVGTVTITATAVADSTQHASVTLSVIPVPVRSVVVSPSQFTVVTRAFQQLSATPRDSASNALAGRVITWSSSNTAVATVSATGLVTGVQAGSATITATCDGVSGSATASVTNGVTTLNLALTSVTTTQVVQRPDNSIPLVAGNAALVSVYGTSNQPSNSAGVLVRVRVFKGTQTIFDDTRAATGTIATTTTATQPLHQVLVPGNLIQPGISVSAEVNPAGAGQLSETTTGDNVFPQNGVPLALAVRTMPSLAIHFIPFFLSYNSATATVATSVIEPKYLATLRKIHPLNTVTSSVGSTFSVSPDFSSGALGFWTSVLPLFDAKRIADGVGGEYYGVVPLPSGTHSVSTGGYSYIPGRTAMGMDATVNWSNPLFGQQTLAHELGHSFGRQHAPCGNPSNVDLSYPYPGASIGVVGWDVYSLANGLSSTATLKDPATSTDIMSYCYDWMSDYTYGGIINYLSAFGSGALSAAPPSRTQALLVSGTFDGRALSLAPVYTVSTNPELPQGAGDFTLEGFDAAGRRLFSYAFTPKPIDHAPGYAGFAFAIPVDDGTRDAVVRVRVSAGGVAAAERRSSQGAASLSAAIANSGAQRRAAFGASATRLTANHVRVTWDHTAVAGVMVRDGTTGEVLSFATGADPIIETSASSLQLVFSDGVQSVSQVIVPRR